MKFNLKPMITAYCDNDIIFKLHTFFFNGKYTEHTSYLINTHFKISLFNNNEI